MGESLACWRKNGCYDKSSAAVMAVFEMILGNFFFF